jgi:peptidoglycan/xylan/chitin deacetylase (PgdA/CDA1 family)
VTQAYASAQARANGARRPAPALRLSALVHAAVVLGVALQPDAWPWGLATLAANYVALGVAVFFPRSALLGPNISRLPRAAIERGEVCITFDDGPHPDITPRVLDILDRHGAKATFFCVGERVAAHPDIAREIARRGHTVESHSHRHAPVFALYGLRGLRREVQAAQRVIAQATGREPVFFRAPAGFRSPVLDPVLVSLGLRYASWTRRGFDTADRNAGRVLRRLTRGLAAGDILLLHDSVPRVVEVLPPLLAELRERSLKPVSLPAGCDDGCGDDGRDA